MIFTQHSDEINGLMCNLRDGGGRASGRWCSGVRGVVAVPILGKLRDLSIVQNFSNSEETNSEQQTTIGSSNAPNTANEPTEIESNLKVVGRAKLEDTTKRFIRERFALEVSDNYANKALKKMERPIGRCGIMYFQTLIIISVYSIYYICNNNFIMYDCEQVGTTSKQKQKFMHTAGSKSFACVAEVEEKLKDKKVKYEAITSSDSSVNLDDIDNRTIIEVLGPERYGRVRFQGSFVNPSQYFGSSLQQYMPLGSQAQAEVQRLREHMAQMQASIVEQIAQLKAEAT
ncbi:hypothetical protein J1N35_028460 [Gossypium stocksii]|uniref:Uncharacterized protein n=1 Tax=Gossypium stocksii TaxID=47602 RepID=A0A9D3ZS50_9ROSI|nr:hypothetical protein J1N35_028460 [Gossypium stocksii]